MIENFDIDDIGPNILIHLTRGLYPDPRDVLREYLQNAVDSKANNTSVLILDREVIIEDDGEGMSYEGLRESIRLAISQKNPATNVGYKGIGVYSALNVADRLVVRTRHSTGCHELVLEAKSICDLIEDLGQGKSADITKILGDHVTINKIDGFKFDGLSLRNNTGTQIKLESISELATHYYSNKEDLSSYFNRTIPLAFHPDFTYGEAISNKISEYCEETNQAYRTVELELSIAARSYPLYRPYRDPVKGVFEPNFHEVAIDIGGKLQKVGLVWSCMHKDRKFIPEMYGQGLLLKKHGFTIGTELTAMKYFKSGQKFFKRYMGEIVLLSTDLTPNAARDNLEFGEVSDKFVKELRKVSVELEEVGNYFQETSIAKSDLEEVRHQMEKLKRYPSEQEITRLGDLISQVERLRLEKQRKYIESDVIALLEETTQSAKKLINDIRAKLGGHKPNDSSLTEAQGKLTTTNPGAISYDDETKSDDKIINQAGSGGQRENIGLPFSQDILDVIEEMINVYPKGKRSPAPIARKIHSLYKSLCSLSFKQHGTLAYSGTWVFWEILGKAIGKCNDADSYGLLKSKLKDKYHKRSGQTYKDMATCLEHIQKKGNANKHSLNVFTKSGEPLRNEMETLHDFLLLILKEVTENIRSGSIS